MDENTKFIIDLIYESLDPKTHCGYFTVERILKTLKTSNKIENNEEKVNTFLNLEIIKNERRLKGIDIIYQDKKCLIKDVYEEIKNFSLDDLAKMIIVDGKSLYHQNVDKQGRKDKLIKFGEYSILFHINPIKNYNQGYNRNVYKVIKLDDNIKDEFLKIDYCEEYITLYSFLFPDFYIEKDDLEKEWLLLTGEFQIWQSEQEYIHTTLNSYKWSQINNINTTYICDSLIYYSTERVVLVLQFNNKYDCPLCGSKNYE